jgi:phage anti-repressor protein
MKRLIPIMTDLKGKQTVRMKDLYDCLGVKTYFSTWYKNRLSAGMFVEGVDYVKFLNINKETKKEFSDYKVSIEFAKTLTAMERSENKKQVMDYLSNRETMVKEEPVEKVDMLTKTVDDLLKRLCELEKKVGVFDDYLTLEEYTNDKGLGISSKMATLIDDSLINESNLRGIDVKKTGEGVNKFHKSIFEKVI